LSANFPVIDKLIQLNLFHSILNLLGTFYEFSVSLTVAYKSTVSSYSGNFVRVACYLTTCLVTDDSRI